MAKFFYNFKVLGISSIKKLIKLLGFLLLATKKKRDCGRSIFFLLIKTKIISQSINMGKKKNKNRIVFFQNCPAVIEHHLKNTLI